ncbi:MAG: cob(I)yrinic acid a,c-diamide adenosyltransferase [Vicinamibacterales bacterium]
MTIYTRTGDDGETSLFDGTRVSKADARVDTYGDVDELQAWLGFARSAFPQPKAGVSGRIVEMLEQIQRDLFALGAQLADPQHRIAARVTKAGLAADDVARLETWIDELEAALPPLRHFILAGGATAGASLHVARAVCRRAERRMVALGAEALLITYINRLSDLLFVMARAANHDARAPETEW